MRCGGRHSGPVPVVLIANSMGGRASFRAAACPTVAGVVQVSPWLPNCEPVDQVAGRKVLILHGDRNQSDAPFELSLEYASRARAVVPDLARMEVGGLGICCWLGSGTAGRRPSTSR